MKILKLLLAFLSRLFSIGLKTIVTLEYFFILFVSMIFFIAAAPRLWFDTWQTILEVLISFFAFTLPFISKDIWANVIFGTPTVFVLAAICFGINLWYTLLAWKAGLKEIWAFRATKQKVIVEKPETIIEVVAEPVVQTPTPVAVPLLTEPAKPRIVEFNFNGVRGYRIV